ncbi:DUF6493 family protein [Nonomuraea zeae]|uniref:DUF7825 domain-containing protein n=1 Tax=Nonomuraea zeae TaxID=1642303 RepID=A0A5S4FUS9_9ACTN|nr:DUF6493 family protein [Nonomuraea zeae]TMR24383.1 hypothetical protein ETD85_46685 [Nonomuraea zeae]
MSAWDDLLTLIKAGDVGGTIGMVDALDAAERKAIAAVLPNYLTAQSRAQIVWWEWQPQLSPLLIAGVACMSGASAVTGWLMRRELLSSDDAVELVLELLRRRPVVWQADVAARIVGRLRHADLRRWEVAAALVRELGLEPPAHEPFMTGWLRQLHPDTAAGDPLFAAYGPGLFEIDRWDGVETWRVVEGVVRLIDDGLLQRTVVIDGVLGRLLREGPAAPVALVDLHNRLDLDLEEASARAGDYARLLPVGPIAVADMALRQLRRLEEAGLLAEELFAEVLEALAFRPENKLLRAAVSWAGDAVLREPHPVAGDGDPRSTTDSSPQVRPATEPYPRADAAAGPSRRVDAALRAMALVFTHDALALQERAVRLSVTLTARAGAEGREAIRAAASGLPTELREKIAAAYGGGVVADEVSVTPLAATSDPRRMPPPIASPEELAQAVAAFRASSGLYEFDRLLAGLTEWSDRDPDALRAALHPWWYPFDPRFFGHDEHERREDTVVALRHAFLAFASPQDGRALSEDPPKHSAWPTKPNLFDRFAIRRALEIATRFENGGSYPVQLATPTGGSGHIDAGVLLDRLERLEIAGVRALPGDLAQALLRLPREISGMEVQRAGRLASDAGRACAAWMRGDRLAEPQVTLSLQTRNRDNDALELHAAITLPATPAVAEPVLEPILGLLEPQPDAVYTLERWPLVMPSHREIVAAHLACCLPLWMDSSDGQVQALASLAHGQGPLGAGMAYALTCGMGHERVAERAAATDALLTLAGRGEVPVAELGEAVTALVTADFVKLNRVVAVLDGATQAGAHEVIWAVIARVLPALLPKDGERPRAGLADLLAAGARAARIAGVRADLPEVAAIAARKGSSRLVQEARRLHQLLTR